MILNVNLSSIPESEERKSGESQLPEIIDVNILDDQGNQIKTISVIIESSEDTKKPYLGGYRNKHTGTQFHHAMTQTKNKKQTTTTDTKPKFHRETQTYVMKTRSVQSKRECGTQMKRKDLYIDEIKDRVIVAGNYFNSNALAQLKFEKTIVIQCYWRGYKARCIASQLRANLEDKKRRVSEIEKVSNE